MAAAAVTSPACPLRRSSRLTSRRQNVHDDDDENELTPRALRALKRQRLALAFCPRPKRRRKENTPLSDSPDPIKDSHRPQLSLSIDADPPPAPPTAPSPEPLTPLTPLTPSPESSPSLPGHDRPSLPPTPPHDPGPPDTFTSPPLSTPLDPSLDSLIPFDGLHPPFPPDLSVQLPPQPPQPPLQPLELQDQFHSFPQQHFYVPPPLFVRDREINIWKLACQERVDCVLRRYGIDYIKALVRSEARSLSHEPSSPSTSHTKFRLYTPASYTYSSTSWGSASKAPKAFSLDDESDDPEPNWPIDDADWPDADDDMEDEDEDDYEDDPALEGEPERQAEPLGAAADTGMQVDPAPPVDEPTKTEIPAIQDPPPSTVDTALHPLIPVPSLYLPPSPVAPPPPLSSLHVPLLSEPPRAFMGRGTPPDRRRLFEWSASGRFTTNGMGPPLYLSPVPQRHPSTDVGIIPMAVDAPLSTSQTPHPNGEWTSFLFSVLEGDGVGVGVGTNVANSPHASEPSWYELGLGTNGLELPPHLHTRTQTVDPSMDEGSHSSSTLRFALG